MFVLGIAAFHILPAIWPYEARGSAFGVGTEPFIKFFFYEAPVSTHLTCGDSSLLQKFIQS